MLLSDAENAVKELMNDSPQEYCQERDMICLPLLIGKQMSPPTGSTSSNIKDKFEGVKDGYFKPKYL